ncbi:Response regulator receiver protein [Verrucomicrobia bacterium]|nr:Response regulator receiver protein [Verrucomicrobiota bacterium]
MLSDAKKHLLLLVEDDEADAIFFNWALKKSGLDCAVKHVLDGLAAVDYLRKASTSDPDSLPRTIFLDLKMPGMNGFEVLSWFADQPSLSHIPMVVLTGSDLPSDRERACALGAAEYLVKPVQVTDLQRLLGDIRSATTAGGVRAGRVEA